MKPFNLEAAKAGARFCGLQHYSSDLTYKYVGLMSDGRIAFERSDGILACRPAGDLRMRPTDVRKAVNVYRNSGTGVLRLGSDDRIAPGDMWVGGQYSSFMEARDVAKSGSYAPHYVGTTYVAWQE